MKWFDRWLTKIVVRAWERRDELEEAELSSNKVSRAGLSLVTSSEEEPWGDGLRINVKRIHGGTVVTFYRYDTKHDRSDNRHYIIHEDADFNTELGKLITMESMRG
jgi:hypothetical protein